MKLTEYGKLKLNLSSLLIKFTNFSSGIQPQGILIKTFCKPLVSDWKNKKSRILKIYKTELLILFL